MQNAVMAIWHHSKWTDESPDHDFCLPGEESWCGFQRDISSGTADCDHESPIPEAVADAIYPTFEALSDESLLSRCLHGGTQNQNKAINGLIWQRATKETHASTPTVELATFLAVGHFNDGSQTLLTILEALGIDPGYHCRKACKKLELAILVEKVENSPRKGADNSETTRRASLRHWRQEKVLPMKQKPSDVSKEQLNKCLHFLCPFFLISAFRQFFMIRNVFSPKL